MSFRKNSKPTAALILSIFFALVIPFSVTWYLTVFSRHSQTEQNLTITRDNTLDVLSVTLAAPLWNYRRDKIRKICRKYLGYSYVKEIRVTDSIQGKDVYDSTDQKSTGKTVVSGTRAISANGKIIGSVYLAVSSVNQDALRHKQEKQLLALFITALLVSLILITYAVYHFVLYPLHKQTESVLGFSPGQKDRRLFRLSVEKLNSKIFGILDELKRYHCIVDENVIIIQMDPAGTILHVTRAASEVSGYGAEQLVYNGLEKLTGDTGKGSIVKLMKSRGAEPPYCTQLKCIKQSGEEYWLSCRVSREANGALTMVCEDITHKKEAEKLANTDELTGLMNRRSLSDVLEKLEQIFMRYKTPYTVLMLDIDRFKDINDTHGHQAGDDVLKAFAEVLAGGVRKSDYIARWGGEEFLVACPNTDLASGAALAEIIRTRVSENEFPAAGRITCSIGVSSSKEGITAGQVIQKADTALYRAKYSGRNRVEQEE